MKIILKIKSFFQLSKKEVYFILLVAAAIFFITSIPIIHRMIKTPPNQEFLFIKNFIYNDYPIYYSYINQAIDGKFFFKDLYSNEIQAHGILNIFWLTVGLFAKLFQLKPHLAFQIFKFFGTIFCSLAVYLLVSFLLKNKKQRILCFLFIMFSSGLGFITMLLAQINIFPKDTLLIDFTPEGSVFAGLMFSPHFIFSYALEVLIFLLFLLAILKNKFKFTVLAGIFSLILLQFHIYHFFTILFIPFIFLLIKTFQNQKISFNYLKHYLILFLFCLPPIIYFFYLSFDDPFIYARSMRFLNFTPKLYIVLISFSLFLAFASKGIYYLLKNKKFNEKYLFLLCWLIGGLILIYFPITFQRRLLQGLTIPLSIFAFLGIYEFIKNKKHKLFCLIFLLIPFSLSNLYYVYSDIFTYFSGSIEYISQNERQALDFLKNTVKENETILSMVKTSSIIPGIIGKTIFVANWAETLDKDKKAFLTYKFFKTNINDEEKIKFLKKYNINYIYFSKYEDKIGDFAPEQKPYLQEIFSKEDVKIYKVF